MEESLEMQAAAAEARRLRADKATASIQAEQVRSLSVRAWG